MNFEFSEEQRLFADSVARFVAESYSFEARQRILESPLGFLPEHWRQFADLGWLGATFPEPYGGLGGSALETLVIMEQFGRGLVASPYLASVVLAGGLVLRAGSEAHKQALLPAVARGERRLAVAFAERESCHDLARVATRAELAGDGFVIDGAKSVVLYALGADAVVIVARTAGDADAREGLTLFLVGTEMPGLHARHYATEDGGRASELVLEGVRVGRESVLGPLGGALPNLEEAADRANAALCAEACGAMWAVYERTLEYLKTRRQFGQPLGAFQALQHRMVDVYMKCELARSTLIEATLALDGDASTRRHAVAAAKFEVGRYARDVAQEGVQLHGAIGVTMDYPIGHYLKRITAINATLGDPRYHLGAYAGRLARDLS